MNRIMKGSLIVLSVLIIGLLISLQGTLWAKATKTEVTGTVDLLASVIIDPGEVWVDEGGNTHTKNLVVEAPSTLTIGDETIDFLSREEISGVVDAEGNGIFYGTVILFIPPEGYSPGDEIPTDAIRFSGPDRWTDEKSVSSGSFEFKGSGDFARNLILGTYTGTDILYVSGYLLGPQGE